jgi:hypothetical protein
MLQVFYLNVAMTCCKHILQCFICFIHMLQLFHLSVAKVDLDVGLLSEEERASVGAMAALMWGGVIGHMMLVWKRGRRGASVEETGPNHPGGMGSRAEGSGSNTGVGSGAGAGGV